MLGLGEFLTLSERLVSPMGRNFAEDFGGGRRWWGLCVIDLLRIQDIWSNGKMGREEQIEEREVLDSIFPDEITGKLCCPHCTVTEEC